MSFLSGLFNSVIGAESDMVSIPPAHRFQWDVSEKNSIFKKYISISEHRAFDFYLAFQHSAATNIEELRQFLGGGEWEILDKNGVRITPHTIIEANETNEKVLSGEYLKKYSDPGAVIPIQLIVQESNEEKIEPPIFNHLISTAGLSRGGGGFLVRRISHMILKPGRYSITACTLMQTKLPENVTTFLEISFSKKETKT